MKDIICFTCRFFIQSGLKCAPDAVVRRRLMGVTIAGVPWSVGKHCLYTDGANRATLLGTVVNMFFGENDLGDDFVIFQLQIKPITAKKGHYCTYSNDSPGKDMVLWSRLTWKCKLFGAQGGASPMALPYASCTPKELMEFS